LFILFNVKSMGRMAKERGNAYGWSEMMWLFGTIIGNMFEKFQSTCMFEDLFCRFVRTVYTL
jgi:hypothetical protein